MAGESNVNPKELLDALGIVPKKSLGQNFLHDPNMVHHIVDSAELPADATVLEIGPGTGALTHLLAERAQRLIAVETDDRLFTILQTQFADVPNVELVLADFLHVDLTKLVGDAPYYVVANLPYYITSAIIRKLLDHTNRPQRLVLTVQKEVGERITEPEGDMSILSVSVQFYGKARIMSRLNPAVFWPRPAVDSAVLRIDIYEKPLVEVGDTRHFFTLVRAGFSQKRKQIKNSLTNSLAVKAEIVNQLLVEAHIEPTRRAETLHLVEWGALCRAYEAYLETQKA